MAFVITKSVLFIEVSTFHGVLFRGGSRKCPDLWVEKCTNMVVETTNHPLSIEVSSFQGVLIRGGPTALSNEASSFQGVLIKRGSCCPVYWGVLISGSLLEGFLLSYGLRCPHFRGSWLEGFLLSYLLMSSFMGSWLDIVYSRPDWHAPQ